MKSRTSGLIYIACAMLLLANTAHAQSTTETHYAELPNFHQVNEMLYRGGQPRAGGFEKLAVLGIKTIINLRDDDQRALSEERAVLSAGLRYFNVPLPEFAKPTNEQVERVLSLINDPENQPVFVHCKRGSDRTGTIIAAYRISHDNWTSKQAKQEANHYGMSKVQFEMRDYITDYYRHRARLSGHGNLGTEITSAAASATRRTLHKSYTLTRKTIKQIGRVFL